MTNVPYQTLDEIRKAHNLSDKPHMDIAFDAVNSYRPTILLGLNRFNRLVLRIDQKREKRFNQENRGFYIEVESDTNQTDFGYKNVIESAKKGYQQTKVLMPLLKERIIKENDLATHKNNFGR